MRRTRRRRGRARRRSARRRRPTSSTGQRRRRARSSSHAPPDKLAEPDAAARLPLGSSRTVCAPLTGQAEEAAKAREHAERVKRAPVALAHEGRREDTAEASAMVPPLPLLEQCFDKGGPACSACQGCQGGCSSGCPAWVERMCSGADVPAGHCLYFQRPSDGKFEFCIDGAPADAGYFSCPAAADTIAGFTGC